MGIELERRLAEAGFPMLSTSEDKEELVLAILRSGERRYLKAIPLLLYRYDIDAGRIHEKTEQKALFRELVSHTERIFAELGIEKGLPLLPGRPSNELRYSELKEEFLLHYDEGRELLVSRHRIESERQTRMWLALLFTQKERWTIGRVAKHKPISRTDYEYYSRKTRKKLSAIANLGDFARTQLPFKPKVDEDLFKLKGLLEQWLEEHEKRKEPDITRFFVSDGKVSITFTDNGEMLASAYNLKEFKDKQTQSLLKEHSRADFS